VFHPQAERKASFKTNANDKLSFASFFIDINNSAATD
jgi:hypothetical protein